MKEISSYKQQWGESYHIGLNNNGKGEEVAA